ncbi:MAG TPA: alpha/beta hydrolase [Steroidobacter sp.]|uniref:alpha/beta fold hydrolase n=1 Tax=Steroidobacter sp. TaxID=1978227 RepID=UPI002ED9A62B
MTITAAALSVVGALSAVAPRIASAAPTSVAASFGFADHSVIANGVRLHYVTVGKGEPVLLLPGWPQSWYAWRFVMKDLAASGREVYALDPRGFGDSEKPAGGYDLATASDDVHAFIQAAGLARASGIDIVSHDVGSWIAYAHASAHPEDVRSLVLSEALIPWTAPAAATPSDAQNTRSWHFGFNRLNDLPEILVQGHERAYLAWLFANKSVRGWTIDPAALDEYVRVFSLPGAARAGFDYYREAFNASGMSQMKARLGRKLPMPILTLGADGSLGPNMRLNLQPLAENVRGEVIANCGHYLLEECPSEFTRAVADFWRQLPGRPSPR